MRDHDFPEEHSCNLEKFQIPVEWLLSGEPFIRYRTLKDLLDLKEEDTNVIETKKRVSDHPPIQKIFKKQNNHGYWGTPKDIYTWWPKKNTTFWLLGVLADFGFTRRDRRIARACEYVFSTQCLSGGFGCGLPPQPYDCFTGILAESLARLGYASNSRLQKALE